MMATLADFEISRIDHEQVLSTRLLDDIVDIFRVATNDQIYDQLRSDFCEYFKDLVECNAGIIQVARLRTAEEATIAGIALFKLRFSGWHKPDWEFGATSKQIDLHASIFATETGEVSPVTREFTGDPVLTSFKEFLEADGKCFAEADEDLLILEPVYILPQYQHVDGLARAIIKPVMTRAVTSNVKILAYSRMYDHEYSLPQNLFSFFHPLYAGSPVTIHLDTRETPDWTGPEIIWKHQFQLFGTVHGNGDPYPRGATIEWTG